ncbi:unnamed protein product, partial [Discosporangium mesarthrocarpum]
MTSMVNRLQEEMKQQQNHVKEVKKRLKSLKGELFPPDTPGQYFNTKVLLQHCVGPRLGMGPDDALFCSKFFHTLHMVEATNFHSLSFFELSMSCFLPSLYGKSQSEAASLGFYLKDCLNTFREWRADMAIFTIEAGNKHGFSVPKSADNAPGGDQKMVQLGLAEFRRRSDGWSIQVTNTLLWALKSTEFIYVKCALIIISKVVEVYPWGRREGEALLNKVSNMAKHEDRPDIRVLAKRLETILSPKVPRMEASAPVQTQSPPPQKEKMAKEKTTATPDTKGKTASNAPSTTAAAAGGSKPAPREGGADTRSTIASSATRGGGGVSNPGGGDGQARGEAGSGGGSGGGDGAQTPSSSSLPHSLSAKAQPFVPGTSRPGKPSEGGSGGGGGGGDGGGRDALHGNTGISSTRQRGRSTSDTTVPAPDDGKGPGASREGTGGQSSRKSDKSEGRSAAGAGA